MYHIYVTVQLTQLSQIYSTRSPLFLFSDLLFIFIFKQRQWLLYLQCCLYVYWYQLAQDFVILIFRCFVASCWNSNRNIRGCLLSLGQIPLLFFENKYETRHQTEKTVLNHSLSSCHYNVRLRRHIVYK
jgi:hypothetical protein